jgi:hypothetical protein
MYMVNLPEKGGPLTENQKVFSAKFLKASKYAKAQLEDQAMKEVYQKGITPKKFNAYLVAVSDSLNAPKVNEIKAVDYEGSIGDIITIDATDDFKVTRVRVIILGSDGKKLERGEAVQDLKNDNVWRYTATATNPNVTGSIISVTAFDLPDNETTLDVEL